MVCVPVLSVVKPLTELLLPLRVGAFHTLPSMLHVTVPVGLLPTRVAVQVESEAKAIGFGEQEADIMVLGPTTRMLSFVVSAM